MKIKIRGVIDPSHSWGVVNQSLALSAIKNGHLVTISPTSAYNYYQKSYSKYINTFIGRVGCTVSYTNPHNYKYIFKDKSGCKIALSNCESSNLPSDWVASASLVDHIVVSSEYSRQNFVRAGFREDNVHSVPLGTSIVRTSPMSIGRGFRFLNVSSPHSRKNIGQVMRCFAAAFQGVRDVSLVLKTSKVKRKMHFHVDVKGEYERLLIDYGSSMPDIIIIDDYMEDMSPLFSACNCLVSCSAAEGFGLPMLEARCIGLEVICPNYSGQKDFLSESSAFMLRPYEIDADRSCVYWDDGRKSKVCRVEDDDVIEAMRAVYYGERRSHAVSALDFSWDRTLNSVLELCR